MEITEEARVFMSTWLSVVHRCNRDEIKIFFIVGGKNWAERKTREKSGKLQMENFMEKYFHTAICFVSNVAVEECDDNGC